MIKVKRGEGVQYDAPQHFGEYGVLKLSGEQTKRSVVNYTYFHPNGGCEMSAAPVERVYIVIAGSITVNGKKEGEQYVLDRGDMVYIAPGEEREVAVNDGIAAEVLVQAVKP
jgi:glyoxylate utilization-related uncharacterized protein